MSSKIIKSFEEGAEVSGDILTSGKIKREIKVGLLTCGYFEYWRMYPVMKSKVLQDIEIVTKKIKVSNKNVVCSGLVDTLDAANEAGKLFKKEAVDIVVVVYGTYTADFITLTALDHLKTTPAIFFSMQGAENINLSGDYQGSLRNSGIIGISQITGTMKKMNREYSVIVGSKNDDRAYAKIQQHISAIQAVEDLHEANIGIIGHVFRGMYDIELSKTFLKSTFGVNLILIQSSHLLDLWSEVSDKDTKAEAKKLTDRFRIKNTTQEDVYNSVKLGIAMKRVAEKFKLDAMCFLDQHYVQKQVKTSARMGASLMMESSGICVNCEGDIGGLVTMMIMKSITKKSPLMAEWGEYDEKTNSCLLMGHGIGTPDLAESDGDISLSRTPEEWGFNGVGLNYELQFKPSKATLAHIMEVKNGYRMLLSKTESIKFPKMNYDELYALVRTKLPVKEYLEKIMEYGVSHHCILGVGEFSDEMLLVAKYLGVECMCIE